MPFFDREKETLPLEVLRNLQLTKFRSQVARVWQNTYIQTRYRAAGLQPGDIKTWADVARVPFLTKADLRENYPTGLVSGDLSRAVRVHLTSGTTGVPVSMVYTAGDMEVWTACLARSFTAGGLTRTDVVQQAHGYGLFTGGLGFHYGLEKVGAMVIPTGAGGSEKQLRLMREWGTTVFTGTPTYALHLGEIAWEKGLDPARDLKLRLGFHGGEPCSDEIARRIGERLGYTAHGGGVRRTYGLTEMGGPMAAECVCGTGVHVWADHFLMEVLDPETLEPVQPGRPGELVLSNLSFEAMPLLRYRTGDRVTAGEETCPCGRTHPRITGFLGRVDDMLLVSGTNVFPSQVEVILLQYGELSENWQLVVGERRGLHTLKVRVEPRPGIRVDDRLITRVEKHLKDNLSITCRIEITECGSLPRFEGKAVRVVDQRPAG